MMGENTVSKGNINQPTSNPGAGRGRGLPSKSNESICNDIDIRVEHRFIWPKPQSASQGSRPSPQDILDVAEDIVFILKAHGMAAGLCFQLALREHLCRRAPGFPLVLKDWITLHIPCRGSNKSWHRAQRDIGPRLRQENVNIMVYPVDWDTCQLHTHTVLPDNPIVTLWEIYYREGVLRAIGNTRWQSVNVFHYGYSQDRGMCPITLVINAWDAGERCWWDSIIPTIATFWPYNFRLRLAQNLGTEACATSLGRDSEISCLDRGSRIQLGMSCSGTLGGAIDLRFPSGTISRFGLTTSQAARHHSRFHAARQPQRRTDQKNLLASSSSSSSGSDTVTAATARQYQSDKSNSGSTTASGGAPSLRAIIESNQNATTTKREIMDWLGILDTQKQQETKRAESLIPAVNPIGASPISHRIPADSGPYTWPLDWSVMKTPPNRDLNNIIADTSPQTNIHSLQGKEVTTYSTRSTRPGGLLVSKRGGTTGWTDGIVNGIPAELNFTRKDVVDEETIRYFTQRASAWVGCGFPHHGDHLKFCMAGDAGGIVLESETGDVVGVLFGNDQETGDGYFVPIDVVVRDIEEAMDVKVVNPTRWRDR